MLLKETVFFVMLQAAPPALVGVPEQISRLVLKLLAKAAEDRYRVWSEFLHQNQDRCAAIVSSGSLAENRPANTQPYRLSMAPDRKHTAATGP